MVSGLLKAGNKTCKLTYFQPTHFMARWVRTAWGLRLVKKMFALWESSVCKYSRSSHDFVHICFDRMNQCWTRTALPSHQWFTQTGCSWLQSLWRGHHATQLSKGTLLGDTHQSKSAFWSASFFFPWSNRNFHLCCQICKCFPSGTFIKKSTPFSQKARAPKAKLSTFDCSRTIAYSFSIFWLLTPP